MSETKEYDSQREIVHLFKKILHRAPTKNEISELLSDNAGFDRGHIIKKLSNSREYEEKSYEISKLRRLGAYRNAILNNDLIEWASYSPSYIRKRARNARISRLLRELLDAEGMVFRHTPESRQYADKMEKYRKAIASADTIEKMLAVHWEHDYALWSLSCEYIFNMLNMLPGDFIFDAGFGAGAMISYFLNKENRIRAAGCDFYELYITHANITPPMKGHLWFHMPMEKLGLFPDNLFDASLSVGTLLYQDNPEINEEIVRHLIRITRPGGRIFLGTVQDRDEYPEGKLAGRGFIDKLSLPRLARESGAHILAIGSDREMMDSQAHGADIRYSVLFEKNK